MLSSTVDNVKEPTLVRRASIVSLAEHLAGLTPQVMTSRFKPHVAQLRGLMV